jgi:PAS domain S-box-containing protein
MARPPSRIELTRTLQLVRVPSAIVDDSGAVTWLNDAAAETFGDLRGRSFLSVVAPEDEALARRQLDRQLAGVPVADFEIDVLTRDGRRQHAEVSAVLIEGGNRFQTIFGVALTRRPRSAANSRARLTPRQREVLDLLGSGASTEQIAAQLHLSRETVRNHVRNVLRALGAHSRLEAVALAHRQGLLEDVE